MNIHLLKLIWNRRKDYIWIFIEQFLVFVVLFYCFTQIYSKLEQYLDPGNLDTENVCTFAIIPNEEELKTNKDWTNFNEKRRYIMNKIQSSQYVEVVHKGYNTVPGNRPAWNNAKDSLEYKGKKYQFYLKSSDGNFQKAFHVKMLEGIWFKDEAFTDGTYPAVITKSLVKKMNLSDPAGVKLSYMGRDFKVTGVMNDYKSFFFDNTMPSAIFAISAFGDSDHPLVRDTETAIRVKKGQESELANYFWKEAKKVFPNTGHQFYISDIGKERSEEKRNATISLLVSIIPTLFLTIFAFLGTFSLMYRQVRKNYSEYGLRIAIGSSRSGLKLMVLRQSSILAGIAALLGTIVSLNIYLFISPEIKLAIILESIFSTLALMLVFSFVSVWYPAQKATNIQPSEALKHE